MLAVGPGTLFHHGPCLFACLYLVFAGIALAAANDGMNEEIDYLIAEVALSDCVFIRNGKEHEATAASKHLQMKRQRGKRYYDTTEQFIDRIASKSSWSGKEYRIRCKDGTAMPANAWFSAKLTAFRAMAVD